MSHVFLIQLIFTNFTINFLSAFSIICLLAFYNKNNPRLRVGPDCQLCLDNVRGAGRHVQQAGQLAAGVGARADVPPVLRDAAAAEHAVAGHLHRPG